MSGVSDAILQQIPRAQPGPLPDRFAGQLLEHTYFEHVHPQYPFLHRPTFQTWQENVFTATETGLQPDPTQLYFVYMVYAIAALITPLTSPSSAESFQASAEALLDEVMSVPSLVCVQAILCCAMFSMRSISGASLWTLSGLALRQSIELGESIYGNQVILLCHLRHHVCIFLPKG